MPGRQLPSGSGVPGSGSGLGAGAGVSAACKTLLETVRNEPEKLIPKSRIPDNVTTKIRVVTSIGSSAMDCASETAEIARS